ncbi:MAG: pimeloyl-ACP methyl ester carboxylesterase [Limisphaerales bacterium]|jgi:pimeloyl-ACP methyl ester carboxylesterase
MSVRRQSPYLYKSKNEYFAQGNMYDLESKYVQVNGVNLHYKEAGKGELVILLHGFPEFWYSWRTLIPVLAEHYHVVAPDMRGYNLSEKPSKVSDYKLSTLRDDVKALIAQFGAERAHIVAHDWGGVVAWQLVIDFPELVDRFVVLNCPHPSAFSKELKGNFSQLLRSWYMFFFQIPFLPELLIAASLKSRLKAVMQGWSYNKQAYTDDDIEAYVRSYRIKGTLKATINYYRALFRYGPPRSPNWRNKIAVPTKAIWGENDKAMGVKMIEDTARYFNGNFKLVKIANCSHWVQHEYPEQVNKEILNFLLDVEEDNPGNFSL